jgi:hypothetical protein
MLKAATADEGNRAQMADGRGGATGDRQQVRAGLLPAEATPGRRCPKPPAAASRFKSPSTLGQARLRPAAKRSVVERMGSIEKLGRFCFTATPRGHRSKAGRYPLAAADGTLLPARMMRRMKRFVVALVNARWLLLGLAVSELIWWLLRAWASHLRATL